MNGMVLMINSHNNKQNLQLALVFINSKDEQIVSCVKELYVKLNSLLLSSRFNSLVAWKDTSYTTLAAKGDQRADDRDDDAILSVMHK